MHRSGTTLLSKLFNKAGVFQGVFRDHNSEAFHFLSINQQTLAKSGHNWLEPTAPKESDYYSISAEELYAIHFQFSSNAHKQKWLHNYSWGWKDPRNTFTLPMYLNLFPKAKVIHVIRNGMDVALSLKQRNAAGGEVVDKRLNDLSFNFKLWETYVEQGNSYNGHVNQFLEIKYEDLLNKNSAVIDSIEKWGGIKLKSHLNQVRVPSEHTYSQELQDLSVHSVIFKKWYDK